MNWLVETSKINCSHLTTYRQLIITLNHCGSLRYHPNPQRLTSVALTCPSRRPMIPVTSLPLITRVDDERFSTMVSRYKIAIFATSRWVLLFHCRTHKKAFAIVTLMMWYSDTVSLGSHATAQRALWEMLSAGTMTIRWKLSHSISRNISSAHPVLCIIVSVSQWLCWNSQVNSLRPRNWPSSQGDPQIQCFGMYLPPETCRVWSKDKVFSKIIPLMFIMVHRDVSVRTETFVCVVVHFIRTRSLTRTLKWCFFISEWPTSHYHLLWWRVLAISSPHEIHRPSMSSVARLSYFTDTLCRERRGNCSLIAPSRAVSPFSLSPPRHLSLSLPFSALVSNTFTWNFHFHTWSPLLLPDCWVMQFTCRLLSRHRCSIDRSTWIIYMYSRLLWLMCAHETGLTLEWDSEWERSSDPRISDTVNVVCLNECAAVWPMHIESHTNRMTMMRGFECCNLYPWTCCT